MDLAVITVVLVMAGIWAGPPVVLAEEQGTEALQIEVTLDEYTFSPDPLRIPAGRPVTLVIRNAGRVPHEFMAGRDVTDDNFAHDLFAEVHVHIELVGIADAGHEDHGDHAEHPATDHDVPEHGHGAADADHDTDAEAYVHGGGDEHGTMVEAQIGETVLMTFTLPESRRGEWMTGCFLPGHFDAGMHGDVDCGVGHRGPQGGPCPWPTPDPKRRPDKKASWCVVVSTLTVVSLVSSTVVAHERKEVAGLTVLFGAEPEPALTEEVEFLRWRFISPESK